MYEKQITIRIDKKLYKALEKEASEQMRSVSGQIRYALIKSLSRRSGNKN